MASPSTLMDTSCSPDGAGPEVTEPSVTENLASWQGQMIVPPEILVTAQPACEQVVSYALKVPSVGWVTTTFSLEKIFPLPTGMSLVEASRGTSAGGLVSGAGVAPLSAGAAAVVAGAAGAVAWSSVMYFFFS